MLGYFKDVLSKPNLNQGNTILNKDPGVHAKRIK